MVDWEALEKLVNCLASVEQGELCRARVQCFSPLNHLTPPRPLLPGQPKTLLRLILISLPSMLAWDPRK